MIHLASTAIGDYRVSTVYSYKLWEPNTLQSPSSHLAIKVVDTCVCVQRVTVLQATLSVPPMYQLVSVRLTG